LRLAFQGRLHDLGDLAANATKTLTLDPTKGQDLGVFVKNVSQRFQNAASTRRQAFARDQSGRLELSPENVTAASFIGQAGNVQANQRTFLYPRGMDLSPLVARGDAVLLAWDAGHSLMTGGLRRFNPVRTSQDTMLRLAAPISRSLN